PLIAGAVRVDADAELALRRAGRPRRAVGRPQIARLALVRVDLGVATAVGELAGRAAPLAAGRRVGDAVVRPVVALLAAVGLQRPVAAEGTVLAIAGAAVVLAVGVVHAVAGGILRRDASLPAVALFTASPDAVAAGGTALSLGRREPAQRQLKVRLRRVAVAAEDGNLVDAPLRQVQVERTGATVAGRLPGLAIARPHRVVGDLRDRVGAGARDEIADGAAGLARQVDLAALLRGRHAVG